MYLILYLTNVMLYISFPLSTHFFFCSAHSLFLFCTVALLYIMYAYNVCLFNEYVKHILMGHIHQLVSALNFPCTKMLN